jgi:hypothetical protein
MWIYIPSTGEYELVQGIYADHDESFICGKIISARQLKPDAPSGHFTQESIRLTWGEQNQPRSNSPNRARFIVVPEDSGRRQKLSHELVIGTKWKEKDTYQFGGMPGNDGDPSTPSLDGTSSTVDDESLAEAGQSQAYETMYGNVHTAPNAAPYSLGQAWPEPFGLYQNAANGSPLAPYSSAPVYSGQGLGERAMQHPRFKHCAHHAAEDVLARHLSEATAQISTLNINEHGSRVMAKAIIGLGEEATLRSTQPLPPHRLPYTIESQKIPPQQPYYYQQATIPYGPPAGAPYHPPPGQNHPLHYIPSYPPQHNEVNSFQMWANADPRAQQRQQMPPSSTNRPASQQPPASVPKPGTTPHHIYAHEPATGQAPKPHGAAIPAPQGAISGQVGRQRQHKKSKKPKPGSGG